MKPFKITTITQNHVARHGILILASFIGGFLAPTLTYPFTSQPDAPIAPMAFSEPYIAYMEHPPTPQDVAFCTADENCMDVLQMEEEGSTTTNEDESALAADKQEGAQL